MKLYIRVGIRKSLLVLKELRKDKRLNGVEVRVGCFTNCREQGLTFQVTKGNGWEAGFTFCVYEHRNSDSIIVNGSPKSYSHMNGEPLPYRADTKWAYWGAFGPDEHKQAAAYLAGELLRYFEKGEVKAHESGADAED